MSNNSIKVVLIGDSGVGKTAIFQRFDNNSFTEDILTTVGGAFAKIIIDNDGKEVNVALWDTAGQEKYRNVVPMYFNKARCVMIVYDITSEESFNSINEWFELAQNRNTGQEEIKFILIGNKSDLQAYRAITYDQGAGKAENLGCDFVEVSAKSGNGFEVLRSLLAKTAGEGEEKMETKAAPKEVNVTETKPQQGNQKKCC